MTLREKIEVMEAFERGEEIEYSLINTNDWLSICDPVWNWDTFTYRIKPKKQVIVIEKWLFEDKLGIKFIQDIEKDYVRCCCYEFQINKVKLLDTYEVEL